MEFISYRPTRRPTWLAIACDIRNYENDRSIRLQDGIICSWMAIYPETIHWFASLVMIRNFGFH